MSTQPPSDARLRRSWFGRWSWSFFALVLAAGLAAYSYTGLAPNVSTPRREITNPAIFGPLGRDEAIFQTAAANAALADSPAERANATQAQQLANDLLNVSFTVALQRVALAAPAAPAQASPEQQRIAQARQAIASDQAQIHDRTTPPTQLAVAQAQLALDQARLDDAVNDAERSSNSGRDRLQQLEKEHQAAEAAPGGANSAQAASDAAARNPDASRGLLGKLRAIGLLNDKVRRLGLAQAEAAAAVPAVLASHDRLHARLLQEEVALRQASRASSASGAGAAGAAADSGSVSRVDRLHAMAREQAQISRFDQQADLATELSDSYAAWLPLARAQRLRAWHAALGDLLVILLLVGLLGLALHGLDRVFSHRRWDRKRALLLRHMLGLGVEAVALVCGLTLLFGQPAQLLTFLGLAGAGLTVAFADAILSIAGWLVLAGRNGVHLGDWVEINGVVGEVIEIRLLKTVLMETGNWISAGHPTGRKVFFPNSYAFKGSYFNFSTVGQWLWDELQVQVPTGLDAHAAEVRVATAIEGEFGPAGEREQPTWPSLRTPFTTAPSVQVRLAGGEFHLVIRYTTPAHDRAAMRERLWKLIVAALEAQPVAAGVAYDRLT